MSAPPPTQHCASPPAVVDSETAAHSDPQSPPDRCAAPPLDRSGGGPENDSQTSALPAAATAADDGDHHEPDTTVGRTPPAAQPPAGEMDGMTIVSTAIRGADAATSATADAPTDTDTHPPSAADRLHRHALECIFAFLDLYELAAALRVSRDWTAAVQSMRRLDLAVEQPSAPPAELARSAAVRHIGQLGGGGYTVRLSGADLSLIAGRMPHLRELHCDLELPPPDQPQPLLFPAQLQRLHIYLTTPRGRDAPNFNAAIAAIGQLPLLEELHISPHTMSSQISFAPLAALPQLRSFGFQWLHGGGELSDAQVDQLRAMPCLRELKVHMTTALLRRLLHQPHDLQWQRVSLPHPFDDTSAALLMQLPSLTAFDGYMNCSRFEWLRGLPNLTVVAMLFSGMSSAVGRAASLVAGLQCCTNIEFLVLNDCADVTAAHLAQLLPRLPRLRGLILASLRIDSLSFLAQPPFTIQLHTLRLWLCPQLPPSELRHVHALRGLTKLELYCAFSAPLDDHDRSLLTPPSAVLPLLQSFAYSKPFQ